MKKSLLFSSLFAIAALCMVVIGQTPPAKVINAGLKAEVTVRRDGRGIPYIEARSDADLYFTQGYVTASSAGSTDSPKTAE